MLKCDKMVVMVMSSVIKWWRGKNGKRIKISRMIKWWRHLQVSGLEKPAVRRKASRQRGREELGGDNNIDQ